VTARRAALGLGILAVVVAAFVVLRSVGSGPGEEEVATDVAVHVAQIGRATLRRFVTGYGRVEAEPAGRDTPAGGALITPFVDGVVSQIDGIEGQPVAKGAVLFRLDSRMAEVAVRKARQQADFAEKAFQRQQDLLASDGTSQRAYLEARQARDAAHSELAAAETDLAYHGIATPIAGTLLHLNVELGQHVDPTAVLAEVVDLDRLVVRAGVPAREIGGVEVGQRVLVGPGDEAPPGVVTVLGRDVDLGTGTYRVLASIPPGAGLLPGQFTDVRIVVEQHDSVLVVPEASVVTSPEGESWIAVVEGGRAIRRAVTPGLGDGGLVEVSGEGLVEGARVVTEEATAFPKRPASPS
jgi:membrane fusion protein (multidrug efflux system)